MYVCNLSMLKGVGVVRQISPDRQPRQNNRLLFQWETLSQVSQAESGKVKYFMSPTGLLLWMYIIYTSTYIHIIVYIQHKYTRTHIYTCTHTYTQIAHTHTGREWSINCLWLRTLVTQHSKGGGRKIYTSKPAWATWTFMRKTNRQKRIKICFQYIL